MAEYREDVQKKLADRKASEAKAKKEDEAVKAVIEDSEMELPDAMIETQQRQIVNDFAQRLQMQGLNMDQYLQYTGSTVEKMLEQVKPQAEERIKSRLVLEAVAAAEKLEATDEEFEAELKKMAEQYKMEVEKIKGMISERERKQIREDLAVQKAADFVVENSKEGAAKKSVKAAADDSEKEAKPKKTTKKAKED